MTELALNYVVNPFARLWSAITYGVQLASYARAAEELRRLGYHKEAERTIQMMRDLK